MLINLNIFNLCYPFINTGKCVMLSAYIGLDQVYLFISSLILTIPDIGY
jgi:hypothetical protein